MFVTALLIVGKTENQPKRSSVGKWIKKNHDNIYFVEFYMVIKKNETPPHATVWLNLTMCWWDK